MPLESQGWRTEKIEELVSALVLESSWAVSREAAVNFSAYSSVLNSWIDKHIRAPFLSFFSTLRTRGFLARLRGSPVFGRLWTISIPPERVGGRSFC